VLPCLSQGDRHKQIGIPKIGERWSPTHVGWVFRVLLRQVCCTCNSHGTSIITEILLKLDPCVPPLRVTNGHWNWHRLIGYMWLPLNSNHGPIPYHFRDKWLFQSNHKNFPSLAYLMHQLRSSFWIWLTPDSHKNWNDAVTWLRKKYDLSYRHLHTIHKRDGQVVPWWRIASHGKNSFQTTWICIMIVSSLKCNQLFVVSHTSTPP